MKAYEKPLILKSDDLSEGVFTASGYISDAVPTEATAGTGEVETPVTGTAASSYTLTETNSWDGNKQYAMTFTNNSDQDLPEISVIVSCIGTVTSIGGNVTGTLNGDNTATITFNNYGNGIARNGTYPDIYVAITGEGKFGIQ